MKGIFGTLCPKGWGFHAKPRFFFNLISGGLYYDALNLDLFQIFLVISQSLGESTL